MAPAARIMDGLSGAAEGRGLDHCPGGRANTSMKQIGILTCQYDLHAYAVKTKLEGFRDVDCHIVELNALSDRSELSWSGDGFTPSTLPGAEGEEVRVAELDVLWFRRLQGPAGGPPGIDDPARLDLIANDTRTAVLGILQTDFSGVFVSDPWATAAAENKIVQLRAAESAGFRVPRTLVSQDPMRVREFCRTLNGRMIVKPLRGTPRASLLASVVTSEMIETADEAVRVSPAMYQEYIPGTRHVRAHCFGESVYAALIESDDVDWRGNLSVPVIGVELDAGVKARLRQVLAILGLKMGVFDLKFDGPDLVWLEVNPQGQFLFIEGLCGLQLTAALSEYLYAEATRSQAHRRRSIRSSPVRLGR